MLRWFAPLLVFAAKPDVLARVLILAIAAGVLAFGVWLLSHIALTFDALKNPYIEATYGIVLACFFIGIGTVTWLRVRRMGAPKQASPRLTPAEPPPPLPSDVVGRRAGAIARKWSRDSGRGPGHVEAPPITASIPTQPAREPTMDARWSFFVTGPAFSGKTALIATLEQATGTSSPDRGDRVRLFDAGTAEGDENHLAALAIAVAAADGVLFVVDQDLRAPELHVIGRLLKTGKPLYIALNKADQLTAADRDAVLLSIRAKMPTQFAPGHVISVAGAPSPVEREIEDARGAVRIELRQPASDVRALINLLGREFPAKPGRSLKFVAA